MKGSHLLSGTFQSLVLSYFLLSFSARIHLHPPSPSPSWRSHCLCNVSKHLCSIRGSQACQNCAKRPSVHPIEVGQMAALVPSLVNCLWQERWRIRRWTGTTLTKALQTVVDTVACTPISEMHPRLVLTTLFLAVNYSVVLNDCRFMDKLIILLLHLRFGL